MPDTDNANAQGVAGRLPAAVQQTTLHCPLCGATAPARGLLHRMLSTGERWELVFICPTCGLYTTFDVQRLQIERIARLQGSKWAAELRHPNQFAPPEEMGSPVEMTEPRAHYITTWIACAVLWLLLTGSFAPVDLLWGIAVCTGVAALTYRFTAFGAPRWMRRRAGWWAFLKLMGEFIRQIIAQNISLSRRVFSSTMPINPGIVAVPYHIRGDIPLTILSSLMTLTPDTVVVDIDQQKQLFYIHWIDVQTTDPDEMHKLLVYDLEHQLMQWLKDPDV